MVDNERDVMYRPPSTRPPWVLRRPVDDLLDEVDRDLEAQYLVEAQADAQLRDYLRRRRAREQWLAEARRAAEEAMRRGRRELWRERREKCTKVSLWVS